MAKARSVRKPPGSLKPAPQPLAGALPHQAAQFFADLVSRGWNNLSKDERDSLLNHWTGEWRMAMARPDPVLPAIRVFDARRPTNVKIGKRKVEALLGPTHTHALTYQERDQYLEDAKRCEHSACAARDVAWSMRVLAAGEEIDRQIVYSPAAPDRSAALVDVGRRREELRRALADCTASANVISAAGLLGYYQRHPDKNELAWDDVGARRPEWIEVLSLRLALVARTLCDKAALAPGVPQTPAPSKKQNTATRQLLARLESVAVDDDDLTALKQQVTSLAVTSWNRTYDGDLVVSRRITDSIRAEREKLRSAGATEERVAERVAKLENEFGLPALRKAAIARWMQHLRSMKNSIGRRSLKSV